MTFLPPGAGSSGYSGFSGISGYSGYSGKSGYSGVSGFSGYSGIGSTGASGFSGYSGAGISGFSGYSGPSGYSGYSGVSGYSGFSGVGTSGFSGYSGAGSSGFSGYSGPSGYSGYSGPSGYSGYSGISGFSGYSGAPFSTAGVATSPTASQTDTITHGLGKTPVIIRIYGIGAFVSNNSATPTPISMGIWNSSGNRCVYMTSAGTTSQASQTSSVFAVFLATSSGNTISGVIGNVGATSFDIVWTETGTATAQNFMWEAR